MHSPALNRRGWREALLLVALVALPQAALALPFDPLPSAFQRWLNSRRDWPQGQKLRFANLAQCSDQTQTESPYRTPAFSCLKGEVTITTPGKRDQQCVLGRVSYLPSQKRVRYWTASCRPSLP